MKKIISTIILLIVLSFAISADDGTTHSGGKSCPTGQTCFVAPEDNQKLPEDNPFYNEIFDYLINFFV